MNLAIFEDPGWKNLLPLTWLRSACELRCGRETLLESAQRCTGTKLNRVLLRDELFATFAERHAVAPSASDDWLYVNSRALFLKPVTPPAIGTAWQTTDGEIIAARIAGAPPLDVTALVDDSRLTPTPAPADIDLIRYAWELALLNQRALAAIPIDHDRKLGKIYPGVDLVDAHKIELGRGSQIKPGAVLDAENGPIIIGDNVLIEPNAVVQGPCYIGRDSIIRPGAAIRPNTSIGPVCRIGGEVEGSIIDSYSNKQHSGFLGHSYIGSWVNLGADTVTSDLKNTYGTIRVALNGVETETGERFIGSIIGDHAKTGIGTLLPTGCIIGTASNIFTRGGTPKFVPSFSWLTDAGMEPFRLEKAIEIARAVTERRKIVFSHDDAAALESAHRMAASIEHRK